MRNIKFNAFQSYLPSIQQVICRLNYNWLYFELISSAGVHNTDLDTVMKPWENDLSKREQVLEAASQNLSYDARFPLQVLNKRKEDSVVHHGDNGDVTFLQ